MPNNLHITALVPIKDHSERVKGKNFRSFCGKPLYQHIVHTLDHTDAVGEIVIDTDSPRVMEEAPGLSRKVRVIVRPEEVRGDFMSMNRVIEHDLSQTNADVYLQTHATNPLLKSETVDAALQSFLENKNCDSLFSVNSYQSRFYREDGSAVNHDPEILLRTQDLPMLNEENSCLYIFTKDSFSKKGRRIGVTPMMYPTPRVEAIDIDDEFTFRIAELLSMY
jgi:CMP-N-acetylneuraminic acid synthetase